MGHCPFSFPPDCGLSVIICSVTSSHGRSDSRLTVGRGARTTSFLGHKPSAAGPPRGRLCWFSLGWVIKQEALPQRGPGRTLSQCSLLLSQEQPCPGAFPLSPGCEIGTGGLVPPKIRGTAGSPGSTRLILRSEASWVMLGSELADQTQTYLWFTVHLRTNISYFFFF